MNIKPILSPWSHVHRGVADPFSLKPTSPNHHCFPLVNSADLRPNL